MKREHLRGALGALLVWTLASCATLFGPSAAELAVRDLIAQGRELLDDDRPQAAEPLFEEAAALPGGAPRGRLWQLRCWMDLGRSNEALDGIDALKRDGLDGPELDYLYGMAFARRAQWHLATGVDASSIFLNFQDAAAHLGRAVEAEPDRFRDAHFLLARSTWEMSELERARDAIETSLVYFPEKAANWLLKGRIAFSQHEVARGEADRPADWPASAHALWNEAEAAFRHALELCGNPLDDPVRQAILTQTAIQFANALVWKRERDEAARMYGLALSWSPDAIDFDTVRAWLRPLETDEPYRGFNLALRAAVLGFRERFPATDPRDASMLWWLGYSHWELGEFEAAETAFLEALAHNPDFTNTWHYIALVRYARDDWPGMIEALKTAWELSPVELVNEMQLDPELNLEKLDFVTAWCVEHERYLDAAILSEICAETAQFDPRYWNNLGLLLRDEADRRIEDEGANVTDPELQALYERAWTAYVRGLEIAPDDGQLMNDTAVMLQYYLMRDEVLARTMYEAAIGLCREALERDDLDEADRLRFEKALEDARSNLRVLDGGEADD